MSASGHCLCGSVTFTVETMEAEHHGCLCNMCRRWSGGAAFLGIYCKGLRFADETHVGRFASSKWAERGFCTRCGTTLFYFLKPADQYVMSMGTFDDQSPFRMVRELFIDEKPAGYAFAGDHERWTGKETFERMTPPE